MPSKANNLPPLSEVVGARARTESSLPTTITRVHIADLKLDPRNPRVHSERQINQLAKSIKSFGFVWPVMIDGMRRVLAGHGRIEAAKRLGFEEVPTISIHHLSESQRRAFMIADNRLAEQATWDPNLLAEQLREICNVELDFDLEATGFEVGEIDVLIEAASPEVKGSSDPADDLPETRAVTVTREGDLWLLGVHLPKLKQTYKEYFAKTGVAAIVFPATMIPPALIGEDVEATIRGKKVAFETAVARNIAPGSTAGLPGLVLPAGMTAGGLPIALEFDGPEGSDRSLLGLGLSVERVLGALPEPRF